MYSIMPSRLSLSRFAFLGIMLSLYSFDVFSAEATFTFIEFNIAFVLGVTLPVLLLALLIKPRAVTHGVFPVILGSSLLILFYSLSYLPTSQIFISLSSAIIFVGLLYLWPLYNELLLTNDIIEIQSIRRTLTLINLCAVGYLTSLWFTLDINIYLSWGLVNTLIFIIGSTTLVKLIKKKTRLSMYRILFSWCAGLLFSVSMLLWLMQLIESSFIIIFASLAYVTALVNANWGLLQQILNSRPQDNSTTQISQDELFNYTHDPITNLPNYHQALQSFNERMRNTQCPKLAAIVFKPINFKQVNSVLGHHNSDLLLLQLAYCLQKKMSNNEQLLPFGSYEKNIRIARLPSLHFLVVIDLTDCRHNHKSTIDNLCFQLTNAVPEAMCFKSFSLNFELAFGIAFSGDHGTQAAEVVEHATDALLQAENDFLTVCYYDTSRALYTQRQLLNMEILKQDLAEDNLKWYLQPQINLNDKHIEGFELLVHWYNGDDKPLELHEFISIAEQSGEVYSLTQKMIAQACSALFNLSRYGIYQPVSINLSSKDLLHPELVEFIEQQTQKFAVSPKQLVVELKESVIVNANAKAKFLIDQLTSIGVQIAIDNFSGNYESLRYIRKMTIKQLKINCTLLGNKSENLTEKAMVSALLNLAKSMKLSVVGFGIDNSIVEQTYLSMGGDVSQGTYVKHGVVFDELEIWLNNWFNKHPHALTKRG